MREFIRCPCPFAMPVGPALVFHVRLAAMPHRVESLHLAQALRHDPAERVSNATARGSPPRCSVITLPRARQCRSRRLPGVRPRLGAPCCPLREHAFTCARPDLEGRVCPTPAVRAWRACRSDARQNPDKTSIKALARDKGCIFGARERLARSLLLKSTRGRKQTTTNRGSRFIKTIVEEPCCIGQLFFSSSR